MIVFVSHDSSYACDAARIGYEGEPSATCRQRQKQRDDAYGTSTPLGAIVAESKLLFDCKS